MFIRWFVLGPFDAQTNAKACRCGHMLISCGARLLLYTEYGRQD